MGVVSNTEGTSNPSFQIGISGPTIFQGVGNPNSLSLSPTPVDGDAFFRTDGVVAQYVYRAGTWFPNSSVLLANTDPLSVSNSTARISILGA